VNYAALVAVILSAIVLVGCGGGHSSAWKLGHQAGASYVSHGKCVRDANGAAADGWFAPDKMGDYIAGCDAASGR
jgi:hypothetical protein